MKKWVMRYVKKSFLFQLGVIVLLWIFLSWVEVSFHNPFSDYSKLNYFDLIAKSIEGNKHTNESFCTFTHVLLGILIVISGLHFFTLKNNGLIDLYVFMMSMITLMVTMSLVTTHNDLNMWIGFLLELLYGTGLSNEMSIER